MIAKRRATYAVFDNSPLDIGIQRPNHSNIAIRFGAYESDAPAESTLKKAQKRGPLAAPQSPDKRMETKQAGPLSEREADRLHAEQTHGLSDVRNQNNHEHHRRDVLNNNRPHIG